MDTITSKKLYNLITSGKMDITLSTSKYYSMPGVADPIEKKKNLWKIWRKLLMLECSISSSGRSMYREMEL